MLCQYTDYKKMESVQSHDRLRLGDGDGISSRKHRKIKVK